MGWIGVVTNAGTALLAQWSGGSETLYITGASVGSGITPEVNMRTATGLSNQKASASIVKNELVGTSTRKLKVRIYPATGDGYVAHEIGIWGRINANAAPTLLALYQDKDEGVSIPSDDESHEFVFDFTTVIEFSNSGELTVNINTSVFVTNGEFMQEQLIRRLMADALPNCEATPSYYQGNVSRIIHTDVNTHTVIRTDSFFRYTDRVEEQRTLNSGESMTITTDLETKKTTYIIK